MINSNCPSCMNSSYNSDTQYIDIASLFSSSSPGSRSSNIKYGDCENIEAMESRLFEFVRTPTCRYYVPILNSSLHIWTLSTVNTNNNNNNNNITTMSQEENNNGNFIDCVERTPIVWVGGILCGIGLLIRNVDALSENGKRPFHALDPIGFGRSSRPVFSKDPVLAEEQFVDTLEAWRKEMGLEKMIFAGHSFGGFLVAAYGIKYPERVSGLVFVEPWGFAENPFTTNKYTDKSAAATSADVTNECDQLPFWNRCISNITNVSNATTFMRKTGKLGLSMHKIVRNDLKNNYGDLTPDDPYFVCKYIYSVNCQTPTGEYGFNAISDFIEYAKRPMILRMKDLNPNIPCWFVYGAKSKFTKTSGFWAKHIRPNSICEEKFIKGADHSVYSEKPEEFNEFMKQVCTFVDKREQYCKISRMLAMGLSQAPPTCINHPALFNYQLSTNYGLLNPTSNTYNLPTTTFYQLPTTPSIKILNPNFFIFNRQF